MPVSINSRKPTPNNLEQSLEKLRATEGRFQKLADNVPGIIYQLCITPDGSFAMSYVSSGCYNLYELTPEEIMAGTQNFRVYGTS